MCRLFGAISDEPVDLEFSFLEANKPFRSMCTGNPDGWGVGYYPGPRVHKEAVSACESSTFIHEAKSIHSPLVLAHVREGTIGGGTVDNTHPFRHGDWLFAHNGTLDIREKLYERLDEEHQQAVKGETDSEVYFLWLVQNVEEHGREEGLERALRFVLDEMGEGTSALNFVMADGENLYAYRRTFKQNEWHSLMYLPSGTLDRHESMDTGLCIDCGSETEGVIVASEALTDDDWEEMANGEMLVVGKDLEPEVREV